MKIFFALLLTGFITLDARSQPGAYNFDITPPFDLAAFHLKGKVQRVTEKTFLETGSTYEQGTTDISSFNASGKLIEVKHLLMFAGTSMGTVIWGYNYDAKNRVSKALISDETGKADETETYRYNANGQLISMEYNGKESQTKETYEYDSKGFVTKKLNFSKETKPYQVTLYTHDESGRCITAGTDNVDSRSKYLRKFNYKGSATQPVSVSYPGATAGAKETGTAFTYNEKGDITASTDLVPAEGSELNAQYYSYVYDKGGNWTKVTITGFGAGYKTRLIEYFPVEESADSRYKKLVMEYSEPTMSAFSNLGQAAMSTKKDPAVLLADQQSMLAQARTDIAKLRSIPDLPGNNTKQLVLQFIEYISSPSTTKKLQNIFRKEGDYASDMREIGTQVSTKRTEMMTEFKKLP